MTPRDDDRRLDSPPLQGRGRGWGLSANAIAQVHDHAATMRRNPTGADKWTAEQVRGDAGYFAVEARKLLCVSPEGSAR